MPGTQLAAVSGGTVTLSGGNQTWVIVVALVALGALGVAALLVREVLAADEGTEKMKEIAAAVREGTTLPAICADQPDLTYLFRELEPYFTAGSDDQVHDAYMSVARGETTG